jgi:hypothetical protein
MKFSSESGNAETIIIGMLGLRIGDLASKALIYFL